MFSRTHSLFILALLVLAASAHIDSPHCAHNRDNDIPQLLDVQEEFLPAQSRVLQTITYPNIRISTDYTYFVNGTTEFISYVKQRLLPPVVDYFEAALRLKQPLTAPIKLSSSMSTICGYKTPKALVTGADADFYVIVSSDEDEANWVASAGSCYLSTTTKRPLIAKMLFNMIYTKAAQDDILAHEKNMYLTMHEMMLLSVLPLQVSRISLTKTARLEQVILRLWS